MEYRYIYLNLEQFLTIKKLFIVAGTTGRTALTFVHYDSKKQRLCCTNGQVARFEYMDLGPNDMDLDKSLFAMTIREFKRQVPRKGGTLRFQVNIDDWVVYPDIDSVIPDDSLIKPLPNIGLTPCVLNQFCESYRHPHNPLAFYLCGLHAGIIVKNKANQISAIVMPARMFGMDIDGPKDLTGDFSIEPLSPQPSTER